MFEVTPEQIKNLRLGQHLSMQKFADMLNTTRVIVWGWETGRHRPIGLTMKVLYMMINDSNFFLIIAMQEKPK